MRNDIEERKGEVLGWVEQGQTKTFICKQLRCKPETLNRYLSLWGVSYIGNQGGKGIKTSNQYLPASEYIKSSTVKSHVLKLKLLRDGLKEFKCEKCGSEKWLDSPIPLELHHQDGDHFNNSLDNLVLLCPNCHALEPNNSGAASKKNKPE